MDSLYTLLCKKIDRIIKRNNIKSICDYGCGEAELLFELKKMNPQLERVAGIDYFSRFENRKRPDTEENENWNIEFVDKSSKNFKKMVEDCKENQGFDLILSTFSLHHWEFPVKEIQRIHSMLAPNGFMVTIDFGFDNKNESEKVKNLSCFIDQILHACKKSYHRHHFTIAQTLDLLKSADFHIEKALEFEYKETAEDKEKSLKEILNINKAKVKSLEKAPEIYKAIFSDLFALEKELLLKHGIDYSRLFIIKGKKNKQVYSNTQSNQNSGANQYYPAVY